MIRCRTAIAAAAAALLSAAAGGGFGAGAAAAAEAPQWRLALDTSPTNLVPESPRDQSEEVTVHATGGTFTLGFDIEATEHDTSALPYDATAAEVQQAIEALGGNLSEKITVVGDGAGETSPYRLTYTGAFVDERPLPQMTVHGAGLTGPGASASVKLLVAGEFATTIKVIAVNVGGAATDGATINLSDVLPAGVKALTVSGHDAYGFGGFPFGPGGMLCKRAPEISCSYSGAVLPGDQLIITAQVEVEPGPQRTVANTISVSGGGAASATEQTPMTISEKPASFGFEPGGTFAALSTAQAGAHPSVTTGFALNLSQKGITAQNARDVSFDLPPGLVGQATQMPRCTMAAVEKENKDGESCPRDTMVGMATVTYVAAPSQALEPGNEGRTETTPIYNIAPAPGEPVAFGFLTLLLPVRLDTSVLSNGDYGVRVSASGLTEGGSLMSSVITIWGVPEQVNGPGTGTPIWALVSKGWRFGGSGASLGEPAVPLLTNPQQCATPLVAGVEAESWQSPGVQVSGGSLPLGGIEGCEGLRFEPSFSLDPSDLRAGAPAGYDLDLKVPQRNEVATLATPTVKNVKLTLPEGVVINPSAAQGLTACSNAQFYGPNHPSEEVASPAKCPSSAQVGRVAIKTPALEEALEGEVYLATPECGPCTAQDAAGGKMVRLFLNVVGNGEAGIVVKLEGHGQINQQTGQITAVFENDPQLPFSELKLELAGGERAVLANPRSCGELASSLSIASWDEALPESVLSAPVAISEGCFGPQFSPSFTAGMPNNSAGAHGEFTLAFGREDHDQFLRQITLHMPPGLLGTLSGVELCKQAQANAGTCGANSLIGEAQVLTGPGTEPFLVQGGRVYLTEGYGGSQFGLSIVVPAVAGPYTLGGIDGEGVETDDGLVVVRSQLFIDPHTAQITAVSGDLPSMLDGIPLQLKAVNVKLNRPGFMFNPTSCERMAITGTIASSEGMSANVSSPFQLADCGSLSFAPRFEAFTKAKHSRADGALLRVRITYPKGAQGTQANLAYAKVELPRGLPSRLETLKQACLAKVFEANPASCPAASIVGRATVRTPVLPVPLTGPAYFVSHGGEAYPSLVMVLQGYGVTIELVGDTEIKGGVTSSTFHATPDVPFEAFELTLPEGPHSALAANGNLCRQPLAMPTRLIAQNGKVLEQRTKIEAAGCRPSIYIAKKHVSGSKALVIVHVPSSGTLTATGSGITTKHKRQGAKAGGNIGLTIALSPQERAALAAHHRHAVTVTVHLSFHRASGSTLTAKARLRLR